MLECMHYIWPMEWNQGLMFEHRYCQRDLKSCDPRTHPWEQCSHMNIKRSQTWPDSSWRWWEGHWSLRRESTTWMLLAGAIWWWTWTCGHVRPISLYNKYVSTTLHICDIGLNWLSMYVKRLNLMNFGMSADDVISDCTALKMAQASNAGQ